MGNRLVEPSLDGYVDARLAEMFQLSREERQRRLADGALRVAYVHQVDMTDAAVGRRIAQVSALRRLCLSLSAAKPGTT